MSETIYIDVEENDNCSYMPLQVFETRAEPVPIDRIRLFYPDIPHGVYEVTGWSSVDDGTPEPAMYMPVSDSGQAEVHLVCGGDWGLRFRPEGSGGVWDVNNSDQWGEPFIVLTDEADILLGA